jgi:hypothetical protein
MEEEYVAVHEEVAKEEAAVETFGILKKRHVNRHLAVGHRRKPKKLTQGDGGSRKNLASARRRMIRLARAAGRKGLGLEEPTVEQR